jgi:hypothetical protein
MARLLVKAVNRGLRVLVSTHSDYLIRELLAPERLGVYFFEGGTNREVPVDERGFEIETIEAEIDRMNETSQTIYAALLEDE